jgi:cytochrome P450
VIVETADLVEHFDHTSPEHNESLLERYGFLRQHCPVAHSDLHGGFWVLSRHRDIVEVFQRHRVFTSGQGITIPPIGNVVPGIPTESDDPQHGQYRRILWPFLTPAAVAEYEPFVRQCVVDVINGFAPSGRADAVADIAKPVPPRVMGRFFGLTSEEADQSYGWIDTMITESSRDLDKMMSAALDLFGFLSALIERARTGTGGHDVMSAIVNAQIDGRPISDTECLGMVFTAIAGALETTVPSLAQALLLLDRHRDVRAELIRNPALVPAAVDEVLRLESPVQAPARTVAADVTVDGCPMKAGDRVLLLVGSANYDEAQFPDPEAFRLDRGENAQLAFGYGVHKCVGQHLARLEIQIVIEEVLRLIPDYTVVGEHRPVMRGGGTRGLETLPIRFTPPTG